MACKVGGLRETVMEVDNPLRCKRRRAAVGGASLVDRPRPFQDLATVGS